MTGPFKIGLYRIVTKNSVRFFRVSYSSSGLWKIHEFIDGDLHRKLPDSKVKLTKAFWKRLVYW